MRVPVVACVTHQFGCSVVIAPSRHAFDASSLNGLATKIMRGVYPPVHPRYSRSLKRLIKSMLSVNPMSRPSFAEILRMPFIKKHIYVLIKDIAQRYVWRVVPLGLYMLC